MIQSNYDCLEGVKKTEHTHIVYTYTPIPRNGNVKVTMQQDGQNITWALLLKGFLPQLSGMAEGDECKDAIELHLVNNPESPLYGGTFTPRIPVI